MSPPGNQADAAVPPAVWQADVLSPYAVETRYPGHREAISRQEVDTALRTAREVLDWVSGLLSGT